MTGSGQGVEAKIQSGCVLEVRTAQADFSEIQREQLTARKLRFTE